MIFQENSEKCLLSIIIVNFNTEKFILKCISSIFNYITINNYELIIVDNNPSVEFQMKLKEFSNEIRYIPNEVNYGFGKACNIGAEAAEGKYTLFLNPDIEVKAGSIENLLSIYQIIEFPGIISGVLINEQNQILYSYNHFPCINWEIREAFSLGLNKSINRLANKVYGFEKEYFEVDWAHGAVLLLEKELFINIGGFNEDYFMYYEDVDLQRRIKYLGRKNILAVNARFYHHERSSIDPDKPRIVYFHNMHYHKLLYYKKHHKAYKRIILRFLFLFSYFLRIFLLPLTVKSFKEYKNKFLENKAVLNVYFRKVN